MMAVELMEPRVLLSTATPNPTSWMGSLGNGIPLTDISMPGTYNSAAGPSLQDALLGSGSENQVNPPSATNTGVNSAALTAHAVAAAASEAALIAGGANAVLNATATTASGLALVADAAAGITQISSGAGLGIGIASDITGLTSAIAANIQSALAKTSAADDAAANAANEAVTAADATAGAAATTAGAADAAAGAADATAGGTDAAAGGEDAAAGTADAAAGTADATALAADTAAAAADVVSAAQGGIDPVSDGVTAGLDTAGAVADGVAVGANTAADAANVAADALNGTADAANTAAEAANTTAESANTAMSGTEAAADAANSTAVAADGAAASAHTASAIGDGVSAASYVAATAADALTAQQYGSYAAAMGSPDSTGSNSSNSAYQNAVYGLAVTGATAHSAASAAEAVAAVADTAATVANTTAASANTAAVTALTAATAANTAAVAADATATAADVTASAADVAATAANLAAIAADTAATAADSAAEALEAVAGIADGVSAGTEVAAAAADTTAIALDITALATVEIPFVDIATAAAAGIADGVAAGLDATSVVADGTDIAADVAADVADGTAVAADTAATTADAAATAADATATADDATATAADSAAATVDATAATDDAASVTACETATAANEAADAADNTATTVNNTATHLGVLALAADVAFYAEVGVAQNTQSSLQTQTLGIADQLNAGIRSLDLRGAQVNDTINLNAGQYFTGTTLQDALNDMTSFLQANPSETIVVTLSANEAPAVNSSSFATDLNTLLNTSDTAVPGTTYNDFVYASTTPTSTPTLGEVRGKIVIIPSGWTPAAATPTVPTIGWQPTQVVEDSPGVSDTATRWNDAENNNAKPPAGLIPADLGNPDTLYRTNLSQNSTLSLDGATGSSAVALGDSVDAIAEQYFGNVRATRTTGIVGMDDPDQNLINEIINQNNAPIVVTSDSDAPGDSGTLRDAILQANGQSGLTTIEFADALTGTTGNTISLQSDLPQITGDLVVDGGASIVIATNHNKGLQAASSHSVTETNYVASDSGPVTPVLLAAVTTPVYLNVAGITTVSALPKSTVSADPVHITYGTALADSQLHGFVTDASGGSIPGTFSYGSAGSVLKAGSVLNAGNGQSVAVTFTPTDTSITPLSGSVSVNVAKATPTLGSVSPVSFTYSTALANSQLSGTATFNVNGTSVAVPGTFVYTSAAGRTLHVGNGQSESVTFIPTDATDYTSASSNVTVNVAQATPTLTLTPINLGYGTALDNTQISGTSTVTVAGATVNVPGTFTFSSADGTTLNGGSAQSEAVTFTPADTTDYQTVSSSMTVNVSTHATPTANVNPVSITYGTVLANSQLSGFAIFTLRGNTVVVPGTFAYKSAAGSVLGAGNGQSVDVTFNPNDTTTYMSVDRKVVVNVAQATPALTINSIQITYGTALANSQLGGTAVFTVGGASVAVPGTYTYTSAAGSVLHAGNGQSEAVTFTPTDSVDYTTASSNVTVNVAKATPIVGGVNPVTLIYGTALSDNPVAEVDTFTPAGTITSGDVNAITINLSGGKTHTVTFTTGSTTTAAAVTAGLVAAWNADPVAAAYATATGSNLVTLTCTVPGTTMSLASRVTGVGTLTKTIATIATRSLSGTVTFIVNGNSVVVPGTFTYTSAAGSVLNIGNGQSETVTFTPNDSTDYTTASSTVTVNVLPITPTVTVTDAGGIYKGSPFRATGTATGVGGVNLVTATPANPTFAYYLASDTTFAHPLAGAPSDAGNYVAVAVYAATGNYGVGAAKTSYSITPATTNTSMTTPLSVIVYGQQTTYTATVTNTDGTPVAPAGAVQFVVSGAPFGSPVPLIPSGVNASGQWFSQAVSPLINFLATGNHDVQARYQPATPSLPNFPNFDFKLSDYTLTQGVQPIATEDGGTTLYIGSSGATSSDQVLINPIGKKLDGSTGVQIQTRLNGIATTIPYSQLFSSVHIYGQAGNDNIQMNPTLTVSAVVSAGVGNDTVTLGGGNNIVTLGNGNSFVTLGDGSNVLTVGNGNNNLTLGKGNNVVVAGFGNDVIVAGNGNNLIASGFGYNSVKVGSGNNILIDGNVALTQSGDSLAAVLRDWTTALQAGKSASQIHAALFSRLLVTYNVNPSQFTIARNGGLDWFWYTDTKDTVNPKPTDLHN
jgi:hypothetical protein